MSFAIRRIDAAEARARAADLAAILLDCVRDGASVSFMADMNEAEALAFWSGVADGVASGRRILLVAEADGRWLGTVQVVAAGVPNQPHRSDLSKMLVTTAARGRGVGAALLAEAEARSLAAGWWLMVLDTVTGTAGFRLYERGGWVRVGEIPNFALWPDGRLCPTTYFHKDLRPAPVVTIALETPDRPDVRALLEASDAFSAALYPTESNHMLSLDELLAPNVRFFVARRGGAAAGCGCVVINGDGTGELKRFFVGPHARGAGLAGRLLEKAEQAAKAGGVTTLRLETGVYSAAALALYRRHGFRPVEAFPPYQPDPLSVFMQKSI